MKLTAYKIERCSDNKTKFFIVNTLCQKGFGFQIKGGKFVYGISFTQKSKDD